MQIVTERRIRHLPVVEQGQVVGLISIGDLLKWVIREQEQEIEQLQQYIAG
jgi:signal-transduction protein with cAMP-binding, CBS, and nucleotidyltransferase domain